MSIPSYFSTFPVRDKKPLVGWADFQERKPTKDELDSWYTKYGNYQRGIVTGAISKILVLDDDGGLDLEKYPIPKTLIQNTPRGGKHYFFRWTSDLDGKVTTRTEILPKVDIRGKGGFVVLYGFSRPYHLQPIAEPPQWLIDLLPNREPSVLPSAPSIRGEQDNLEKSYIQELLDGIHIGNRNDSFTRIAGSFRGRGYSSADIFGILSTKAREVGFGLDELKIICDSVNRYAPNIRIDDNRANSIEDFLKDQETVEWICEGMIAKRSIGFIAGLPETGKTWAVIDLAIECAKGGGMWLGKFPVTKQKVLFIDQERFRGETQRRFKSLISGIESLTKSEPITNLFVKSGTTIRLNLQHSFDAFRKELSELRPDLVIVDSFVTFHTCEENNRKDIQTVLERVKELRNEFGCTFLFIHHENKNAFDKESGDPSIAQMAGSIAIPAVAETVFTVRKHDNDSSMFYHTKSTLSSTVSPFLVKVVDQNIEKTKIKIEAY